MDEFIKNANKGKIGSTTGGASIKVSNTRKNKKPMTLETRRAISGWLFILPFVIGFLLIYLPIIFDSIKLSFHTMENLRSGGYVLHWVGFDNYKAALLDDPAFLQTLLGGVGTFVLEIPAIVIFSLFVAIILNQKMAGRAAFRAIFFIPVILSTGLIASIDATSGLNNTMDPTQGIDDGSGQNQVAEIVSAVDIEKLFSGMVVGTEIVEFVAKLVNNIYDIVNRCGVQMLIFLAGLQSISPAIYESCSIDGASAWETFWKITLPMISPMILVNSVYTIIDSFTAESNGVMSYINGIYNRDTTGQVVSSAMSWMYFLFVILIVAVVAAVMRIFTFYQRRDS